MAYLIGPKTKAWIDRQMSGSGDTRSNQRHRPDVPPDDDIVQPLDLRPMWSAEHDCVVNAISLWNASPVIDGTDAYSDVQSGDIEEIGGRDWWIDSDYTPVDASQTIDYYMWIWYDTAYGTYHYTVSKTQPQAYTDHEQILCLHIARYAQGEYRQIVHGRQIIPHPRLDSLKDSDDTAPKHRSINRDSRDGIQLYNFATGTHVSYPDATDIDAYDIVARHDNGDGTYSILYLSAPDLDHPANALDGNDVINLQSLQDLPCSPSRYAEISMYVWDACTSGWVNIADLYDDILDTIGDVESALEALR